MSSMHVWTNLTLVKLALCLYLSLGVNTYKWKRKQTEKTQDQNVETDLECGNSDLTVNRTFKYKGRRFQ
jgi:hypothetical protein